VPSLVLSLTNFSDFLNFSFVLLQEFISSLDITQKDTLLVELLSNGKGSLDYAKNLVKFGGDMPQDPTEKPPWCTCRVCRPMPHEDENKCCGKIRCVTSYVTFQNICTDREVLTMAIRGRSDIRADEPDYSTNSFRKAAYRQYILWRYKKLVKGNRKVVPSCVVLTIRHLYPADDGVYMGFKRA
jgi:P2X purinoceptor 7